MLELNIPDNELWNEEINEFISVKGITLKLEHSLVSLQKWESKWNKPYLTKEPKTYEENIDYIRCMTLNNHVDPMVYYFLTEEDIKNYVRDLIRKSTDKGYSYIVSTNSPQSVFSYKIEIKE